MRYECDVDECEYVLVVDTDPLLDDATRMAREGSFSRTVDAHRATHGLAPEHPVESLWDEST